MDDEGTEPATRSITSEGLSSRAVTACWSVAVLLMGSGITATFVAGTGAAPAAMILFGSLFLVLALMKRVPLSLEVGGAKFDATYVTAEAFDAGREVGLQQGVEVAIIDVEKAEDSGEAPHAALERRRDSWQGLLDFELLSRASHLPPGSELGYRAPVACNAAGITYRQVDYWDRTGLVSPSARGSGSTRLYTVHDVVMLKVIKRLLDAGVSLQQIRSIVLRLRERSPAELERITLMSDGRSIYETTTVDEVIDLMQSGKGMVGIAVGGVSREVLDALSQLPPEPALLDRSGDPT